jgi:mycoredoxin
MVEDVLPLPDGLGGGVAVTVLWRPGCPFCAMLLRSLERTGLVFDRVDIWEEPAAAAWVRSVADGNETVPTVRVAGGDPEQAVALVNPSATEVLRVLARLAPGELPTAERPARGPFATGPCARGLRGLIRLVRGRRGPGRAPGAPR